MTPRTVTFTLDEETLRLIGGLQKRLGEASAQVGIAVVTKVAVVRLAIRLLAEREGIRVRTAPVREPGRPRKDKG